MERVSARDDSTRQLQLTIENASQLRRARAEMRDWLEKQQRPWIDDVLLACGEAIDNALEHGDSPIRVSLHSRNTAVTVTISDNGTWRVSADVPTRGIGIPIMTALMDSLTVDTRSGTTIVLTRDHPDDDRSDLRRASRR